MKAKGVNRRASNNKASFVNYKDVGQELVLCGGDSRNSGAKAGTEKGKARYPYSFMYF